MSAESLHQFLTAMTDTVARKARDAMDGSPDPAGFVALGRVNGYDFTPEEVVSYLNEADGGAGGYDRLAAGVAMFRRMGRMNVVPSWASRMYSFAVQADMRFW
jgi:hypothetical protein